MEAPIFIFSLPRAGSTLIQRVLMSNKDICSVAEPWILLPQIYALKREGSLSEYSSLTSFIAMSDFVNNLPNKTLDYQLSLKSFMKELYSKQCQNNERYFLDKTPRYYLIIDEIVELFPEAKFIFLFRNPIQVYASMISTWGDNRFNKVRSSHDDLVLGTKLLSQGYLKHKDKAMMLNYENFVTNFEFEINRILDYLDLKYDESMLIDFNNQNTNGALGDPTGVKKYTQISTQSLEGWKSVFNSMIRKRFANKMLSKLNPDDLAVQGYDVSKIKKEIKSLNSKKNHRIFGDIIDYFNNFLTTKFKLHLLLSDKFRWVKRKYIS